MSTKYRKPYALIGAEQLTTSVYKTGDELTGFGYRFNIVRHDNQTGRVNQWFRPDDLLAMVKLTRVLAAELSNDGCMTSELREQLVNLATALDVTLIEISSDTALNGASKQ